MCQPSHCGVINGSLGLSYQNIEKLTFRIDMHISMTKHIANKRILEHN